MELVTVSDVVSMFDVKDIQTKFRWVQKAVEKYNTWAARYDRPLAPDATLVLEPVEGLVVHNSGGFVHPKFRMELSIPKPNDIQWNHAARFIHEKIDSESGLNNVRLYGKYAAGVKQLPVGFEGASNHCMICGHKRKRNFTDLYEHKDSGEFMQVGRMCAHRLFGLPDASGFLSLVKKLEEMREYARRNRGRVWEPYFQGRMPSACTIERYANTWFDDRYKNRPGLIFKHAMRSGKGVRTGQQTLDFATWLDKQEIEEGKTERNNGLRVVERGYVTKDTAHAVHTLLKEFNDWQRNRNRRPASTNANGFALDQIVELYDAQCVFHRQGSKYSGYTGWTYKLKTEYGNTFTVFSAGDLGWRSGYNFAAKRITDPASLVSGKGKITSLKTYRNKPNIVLEWIEEYS